MSTIFSLIRKEELDKYREDQNKPSVPPDSDVLKMLQNTKIGDNSGGFSKLQDSLNNEGKIKYNERNKKR